MTYNKMKSADLEELLKLRGLPGGGSKIQMVSRLVKQDQEDAAEEKAIATRVKAAMGAPTPNGSAGGSTTAGSGTQGTVDGAEAKNGGRKRAGRAERKRKKEAREKEARSTTIGQPEAEMNTRTPDDQDAYIKSLLTGTPSSTARHSSRSEAGEGIIVQMTEASTSAKAFPTTPRKIVHSHQSQKHDTEEKDGFAATVVVLSSLLAAVAAIFLLGGFTMKDIRDAAAFLALAAKHPRPALREAIWGVTTAARTPADETAFDRVKRLCGFMRERVPVGLGAKHAYRVVVAWLSKLWA
ncbi:hypothetical protein BU26DRAFT_156870 [Trematosphaeria pertusa]|uniref:SAP domain-containing protein n=1 Tax=Trematosphaeria pertusa TaxID=390896 RepID=A0A6A6HW02_9PLEO|nr:uncharacterized protein BU26DRAFT_156870 [Trematosphaeria pertusa]KAF2242211.1 hypothetical protein BU26DRAFT_156870 [Trematosphaeria pertusa]